MEIKDLSLKADVGEILKRDGFIMGSAAMIKTYLCKHTNSKMLNKVNHALDLKKLGKALGYVEAFNLASTAVQDFLPHVSEALDWSMALPFNILNQTLGRIPGIGAVFRWLHNALTNTVTKLADLVGLDGLAVTGSKLVLKDPNEGFETETNFKNPGKKAYDTKDEGGTEDMQNDPKFYENLELHKTFNIPGAYTKKTVVNGTLATPKLAVHRIVENPVPDKSALIDRLNQRFSLIKAVRGLSATKYSLIDLANYERVPKYALIMYYAIKRVIQAAKTYNLVQVEIGNNIIDALGFDPSEVRQNLANYETLLCQYHRFIQGNLPMSGLWIKRLEYLAQCFVPDYSDPKVATIHMFAISIHHVFTNREIEEGVFESLVFDEIPGARNNNYAVMLANLQTLQDAVISNDNWQQLMADYFGAFGKAAIWEDKDYPAYAKPLNLANADNDLSREQIKNAFYMNSKITYITVTPGEPNTKSVLDTDDPDTVTLPTYQFGNTFTTQNFIDRLTPNYQSLLNEDTYFMLVGILGTADPNNNYMALLPDMNGVGAQVFTGGTVSMNNHETIYSLHKDNYTEGQSLEISQLKSRSIGVTTFAAGGSQILAVLFKGHEYGLMDTTVYVYGSNGSAIVPQTYLICNESVSDDALQSSESAIDYPDEIMCWALIDWMPFAHYTFFGFDAGTSTYSPRDVLLTDMDAFGSLDDRAFVTSINYSIYSLYGVNLRVSHTKRVDNLVEVYADKGSKRG